VRELAPAKVNLCLLVGPLRADGRHELVSLMQSIAVCDEVAIEDGAREEVICPGVEGENLAAAALRAFRAATGWDGPPQRIEILKRIPVAAGLAGGSADAAAVLRLLVHRSGLGGDLLLDLAAALGSDVPSQLAPGRTVVRGGGERVEPLGDAEELGVLVLPSRLQLSTAAVYAEADRLGLPRSAAELAALDPLAMIGVNDLQQAALSLEPSIAEALELARSTGAHCVMVCGSGPTVVGLFDDVHAAERAATALAAKGIAAMAAKPFVAMADLSDNCDR
jgi:4-diphosphocytidyl-2-C-methyl-D-erythritol kinase